MRLGWNYPNLITETFSAKRRHAIFKNWLFKQQIFDLLVSTAKRQHIVMNESQVKMTSERPDIHCIRFLCSHKRSVSVVMLCYTAALLVNNMHIKSIHNLHVSCGCRLNDSLSNFSSLLSSLDCFATNQLTSNKTNDSLSPFKREALRPLRNKSIISKKCAWSIWSQNWNRFDHYQLLSALPGNEPFIDFSCFQNSTFPHQTRH